MSDRVMYCDRIPYDRSSWDIMLGYELIKKKKSKIEEEYFSYYIKISKIRLKCEHNIYMLEQMLAKPLPLSMVSSYKNKKIEIEIQILQCKMLLSSLEATTPIQSILQRERKPNEVITLRYLNTELPDIPYCMVASQPRYLTNKEIQQIKCMEAIEINSSIKTTQMQTRLKEIMPSQTHTHEIVRTIRPVLMILLGLAIIVLAILTTN